VERRPHGGIKLQQCVRSRGGCQDAAPILLRRRNLLTQQKLAFLGDNRRLPLMRGIKVIARGGHQIMSRNLHLSQDGRKAGVGTAATDWTIRATDGTASL